MHKRKPRAKFTTCKKQYVQIVLHQQKHFLKLLSMSQCSELKGTKGGIL